MVVFGDMVEVMSAKALAASSVNAIKMNAMVAAPLNAKKAFLIFLLLLIDIVTPQTYDYI